MSYESDNIFDVDQFTEGMQFIFRRVTRERIWDSWYDGEGYATQLPSVGTFKNGYAQLASNLANVIKVNLFKLATDVYVDGVFSDRPDVYGDSEEFMRWWEENAETIYKKFDDGNLKWAIKGLSVYVTHEDGSLLEVDPSTYFRVGGLADRDDLTAHVIAQKYYDPNYPSDTKEELLPQTLHDRRAPNMIRVFKYSETGSGTKDDMPRNTVQTFRFAGTVIGVPVTEEEDAGITAITTAGRRDSWYDAAADLAGAFLLRLSNNARVLNLADNRIIRLPASFFQSINKLNDDRSAQQKYADLMETLHPLVTYAADEKPQDIDVVGNFDQYPDDHQLMEYLFQSFSLAAGISPAYWDFGLGANASGASIAERKDRSISRMDRYRADLRRSMFVIFKGLGAPGLDQNVTISWRVGPYGDKQAYNNQVREDVRLGILDPQAAARLLGYDESYVNKAEPEQEGMENE